MKYGNIVEATGKLLGWYDDDIHAPENIPKPNIPQTEAEWNVAININANHWNGTSFDVYDFSTDAQIKEKNSNSALAQQSLDRRALADNETAIAQGLPPQMSGQDIIAIENNIQLLQNDILRPTSDAAYSPTEPPAVTEPTFGSLTAHVVREPGWNDVLGYRFTLVGYDDTFVPTNLAMAVYSGADCNGYLYTTGAFKDDGDGVYYAICPPGQEPGDVDIHFGMLEGSLSVSCFTLPGGTPEKVFNVYDETK